MMHSRQPWGTTAEELGGAAGMSSEPIPKGKEVQRHVKLTVRRASRH